MLADYWLTALRGGLDSPDDDERIAAEAGVFRLAEIATLYWQANTKRPGKVSGRRG